VIQGKASSRIMLDYALPLNTKKHNIYTEEAPKMAIIGDYWDQEIVTYVVEFLNVYEDLFPISFLEMKGIPRCHENSTKS
jgi:hypothetical protein